MAARRASIAACISALDQEAPLASATLVSLSTTLSCQPILSPTVVQLWPAPLLVGCSEPATVSISTVALRKYLDSQPIVRRATTVPAASRTSPSA